MSNKITLDDLDNLKHMLGAGEHINPRNRGYRNYASFGERNAEFDRLVVLGLATMRERGSGDFIYCATEVGAYAAGLTRKQIEKLKGNR